MNIRLSYNSKIESVVVALEKNGAVSSFLSKLNTSKEEQREIFCVLQDEDNKTYYLNKNEYDDLSKILDSAPKTNEISNELTLDQLHTNTDKLYQKLQNSQNIYSHGEKSGLSNYPTTLDEVYNFFEKLPEYVSPTIDTNLTINEQLEQLELQKSKLTSILRRLTSINNIIGTLNYKYKNRRNIDASGFDHDSEPDEADITKKSQEVVELSESLIEEINIHIKETNKRIEKTYHNTIIIRTFSSDKQYSFLGQDTSGHTSVQVTNNDGESTYLSYYKIKKEKTWFENGLSRAKIPSSVFKSADGYIVEDLEKDLEKVGEGKKYKYLDTVIISLTSANSKNAYNWIKSQKNAAEGTVTINGISYKKIPGFNLLTKNCAWYAREALRKAGVEDILANKDNINTPNNVKAYSEKLAKLTYEFQQLEKNELMEEENRGKEKYHQYLDLTIMQLDTIKNTDVGLNLIIGQIKAIITTIKLDNTLNTRELYRQILPFINKIYDLSIPDNDNHAEEKLISIAKDLLDYTSPSSFITLANQMSFDTINKFREIKVKLVSEHSNNPNLFSQIPAISTIITDLLLNCNTDNQLSLFDIQLRLKITITRIQNAWLKNIKTKPKDASVINKFYEDTISILRKTQININKEIYFKNDNKSKQPNQNSNEVNILNALKDIFNINQSINSIEELVTTLKSQTYFENQGEKNNIITYGFQKFNNKIKNIEVRGSNKRPPNTKPSVFNILQRAKRHEYYLLKTKGEIYSIVNDNQPLVIKFQMIDKLTESRKPSKINFSRRKDRISYEQIAAEAKLICLVESFYNCKLTEIQFAAEISKLLPIFPKNSRKNKHICTLTSISYENVEYFQNVFISKYNHFSKDATTAVSSELNVVRQEKTNTLADHYGATSLTSNKNKIVEYSNRYSFFNKIVQKDKDELIAWDQSTLLINKHILKN